MFLTVRFLLNGDYTPTSLTMLAECIKQHGKKVLFYDI